jgi:predicted HNH restriction endonuclease
MNTCKYCQNTIKNPPSQQAKTRECKRTVCNSCRVTKRRWLSKIELVTKLGGKCERCGFQGHYGAFHFHHKDPSTKSHEINANKLLTKDRWDEIAKCELLCANCHQIEHSNTKLLEKMGIKLDTPTPFMVE